MRRRNRRPTCRSAIGASALLAWKVRRSITTIQKDYWPSTLRSWPRRRSSTAEAADWIRPPCWRIQWRIFDLDPLVQLDTPPLLGSKCSKTASQTPKPTVSNRRKNRRIRSLAEANRQWCRRPHQNWANSYFRPRRLLKHGVRRVSKVQQTLSSSALNFRFNAVSFYITQQETYIFIVNTCFGFVCVSLGGIFVSENFLIDCTQFSYVIRAPAACSGWWGNIWIWLDSSLLAETTWEVDEILTLYWDQPTFT